MAQAMAETTMKYGMTLSGKELHIIAAWRDEPTPGSGGRGFQGYFKTACKRTYYAQWTYQDAGSFRVCPKCAAI